MINYVLLKILKLLMIMQERIRLVNSYLNREIDKKEFKVRMCAYYADSRDKTLFYSIHRLNHFPINFKITKYDWRIYTKNRKENIKPQI